MVHSRYLILYQSIASQRKSGMFMINCKETETRSVRISTNHLLILFETWSWSPYSQDQTYWVYSHELWLQDWTLSTIRCTCNLSSDFGLFMQEATLSNADYLMLPSSLTYMSSSAALCFHLCYVNSLSVIETNNDLCNQGGN